MTHRFNHKPGIEENALYKVDSLINQQYIERVFNKYSNMFAKVDRTGWQTVLFE